MDRKKLCDEIISCRPAVRKARVAVIRKIIKTMKILKTCKLESVKEKKLRKSERLFEKVQIMKKVKDDEVTEFALRNKDLEVFINGPQSDLKSNALACLAKHDAVVKKIKSIREQISNWETELPVLLDSLEKKKEEVVKINKNPSVLMKEKEVGRVSNKTEVPLKSNFKVKPARQKHKFNDDGVLSNKSDSVVGSTLKEFDKIEKIEDPFFIDKKVIAPKLVLERSSSDINNKTKFSSKSPLERERKSAGFHGKTLKMKQDINKHRTKIPVSKEKEEKLHPSWAAKKVKLIKPFQGKKITFSDD